MSKNPLKTDAVKDQRKKLYSNLSDSLVRKPDITCFTLKFSDKNGQIKKGRGNGI